MKTIPLTQGQVALVDDEDYEAVARYKWHAHRSKRNPTWYAYRTDNKARVKLLMHREILGITANKGQYVDHINHNGLDNRRANLRMATRSQNGANQKISKRNSSGFRGVSFNKPWGRWTAQIRHNQRLTHLGGFDSAKDAARAYDEAARRIYGEFASVNFPERKEITRYD